MILLWKQVVRTLYNPGSLFRNTWLLQTATALKTHGFEFEIRRKSQSVLEHRLHGAYWLKMKTWPVQSRHYSETLWLFRHIWFQELCAFRSSNVYRPHAFLNTHSVRIKVDYILSLIWPRGLCTYSRITSYFSFTSPAISII